MILGFRSGFSKNHARDASRPRRRHNEGRRGHDNDARDGTELASELARMGTRQHAAERSLRNFMGSATDPDKALRIFVVDDHPLVRDGLAARIGQEPDMRVCGEADSVSGAQQRLRTLGVDVVILDLALKDGYGLELIKAIKKQQPLVKILVFTGYGEEVFGQRVLRLGADGYVSKQQAPQDMIDAIRAVAAGERYVSERLAQRLMSHAISRRASRSGVESLSDRELEVFLLIGRGNSTRAIAEQLGLSIHTIETHREKIRGKLGLRNSAELVQSAVQWIIENQ
jgi:DNA-binding NarL/FixJ family response regulator